MENVKANNTTTNGSAGRTDSSNSSATDNAYSQVMQRIMEQQQLAANFAELSNMNQTAAASNMLAYTNPYMMSMGGLGAGLSSMFPAAAFFGLGGLAGGLAGADYQSAQAAMANLPAAALYSSASMGYPSMPFNPAEYASTLAAYASSLSNTSLSNQSPSLPLTSVDHGHTSPALSQSNRSSIAGINRSSSSRQSTPHRTSSTPAQPIPHRGTPTDPPPLHQSATSAPSPKKRRLSNSKKEKSAGKKSSHSDMATFYKGLTADEFDVNTHFKNSLGSLYDNGLLVGPKSTPSASNLHDSSDNSVVEQETAGLDLTVKNKPTTTSSHSDSANVETTNSIPRKSVIQSSKPLIPATINTAPHCGETDQQSSHSSSSTSMTALYSLSKTLYSKPTSNEDRKDLIKCEDQYTALPNLKRLSEQLKAEKTEELTPSSSVKSKNVISLLKHNNAITPDSKPKRKGRKSKAIMDSLDGMASAQRQQRNLEDERDEIKRKLERDIKQPRPYNRVSQKIGKATLQKSAGSTGRGRGRRKSSQLSRPEADEDVQFGSANSTSDTTPPKRTYIRTKIPKEKPVDMAKLAIPFEYGWRRETRLRGVNKSGKMIGEVFYYTPTDKRMRSYNDVFKYLNLLKENHRRMLNNEEEVKEDDCSDEATDAQKVAKMEPPPHTDHSIAKLTAAEKPVPSVAADSDIPLPVANGWMESQTDEQTPADKPVEEISPDKAEDVCVAAETIKTNAASKLEKPAVNRPPEWSVLTKDHFSFNTRVKLGDFMEQKPGERYLLLNDKERDERIECANDKRNKQMEKLSRMKAKKDALKETERRVELAKVENERKHMESMQKNMQTKLKKQLEKARTKAQHDIMKQQKAVAVQMRKKQLQEERDKDRLEKQERSKHLLEERERKTRVLRQLKAQQRIEKAMVRERQRISLLNSKIMETRRREEERRRHQMDKIVQKERKQEIRKRQLELSRELKQPAEDLKLPNIKAMPTLNRIPGMKLPAQVFANVLQFHQFITNFYDCLDIKHSIPTLNTFQQALLSDNKQSNQAVDKILCHMLAFGLNDPGVRHPNKFVNELGQKLTKCSINEYNFSEILRMFMLDRNRTSTPLSQELEIKPFTSLSAALKSDAMAWLCDELNTSQAVTEEIDNNMEQVLNHRRDKWELEGKIRELKTNATIEGSGKVLSRTKDLDQSDQSDNDEDTNAEQLSHLSSSKPQSSGTPTKQIGEDKVETADEKKLDKLMKQYSKCCKDVVTRAGTVRSFPYGMDRYRRYYWYLPSFKGILVESHESSINAVTSDPTDRNVTLQEPSDLNASNPQPDVDVNASTEPSSETSVTKSIPSCTSIANAVSSAPASSITCDKTTSSSVQTTPNGVTQPAHTITSWLSNAIDNIFTSKTASGSPSQSSSPGISTTTSTTTCSDVKLPASMYPHANTYSSADGLDSWFELDRKLPCDKMQRFSPQLIANSLAFMNCVTGSEEQKELEALERLAAKAALLDEARPLPPDVQKGWWIVTDTEQVKSLSSSLHSRALRERLLNRSLIKNKEKIDLMCSNQSMSADIEFECDERDSEIEKSPYQAVVPDEKSTWVEKQCRSIELTILDKVEDLEERVYQASIYTKNWADKKKHDATDLELVVTPAAEVGEGQKRIIDLVKEKLLLLEAGVERRYLKPPFIKSTTLHISDIVSSKSAVNGAGDGSDVDSDATGDDPKASEDTCSKGLLDWQRAVRGAVNMSQLYISLVQLETCIAWEKSVMRVLCQVCRSDDKEDQLLLCDNCDKGYHTYCFKPKMLTIPNGDWYCWECKSKATNVAHCIRCGKATGKMAQCHKCPQAIHLDCCSPPLSRIPRKYTCGHCLQLSNQHTHKRRRRSKHKTYESNSDSEDMVAQESTDDELQEDVADLSVCRDIMTELEGHKDAEPFLEPVDTKAFPQYKKYIKQPMDLSKISEKLTSNQYGSQSEFYDDMILIFDNCLLFNEDSSVVGRCGKVLRKLFQKRWKQLTSA